MLEEPLGLYFLVSEIQRIVVFVFFLSGNKGYQSLIVAEILLNKYGSLIMNRKVKVLVCKSSSCFVEPSCSEPNLDNSPSFSSIPWAAQVAIRRKHECDYAEIFDNSSDHYAEIFSQYTHFVLFGSVFWYEPLVSLQILLLKIAKAQGCRTLLIGNQQGFEQDMQLKSGADVVVSVVDFDPIIAIDLLEENGFFSGSDYQGPKQYSRKDIRSKKHFCDGISFVESRKEIYRFDYWGAPYNFKRRLVSAGAGCPFGCTFCPSQNTIWSAKSADQMVSEVAFWEGTAIDLLSAEFFLNRKWLEETLSALASAYIPIWMRVGGRIISIHRNLDLIPLCKKAGIEMIYVGLESASDRVMKTSNKNDNQIWRVEEILQVAGQYDVGINLNLIVGLPEDDEESLNETYEFIKKYPYASTVGFFRPIPGTSIIQEMKDSKLPLEGNTNLDDYLQHYGKRWTDDVEGVHSPTKYLSKDRVVYWKQKFDKLLTNERSIPRYLLSAQEVSTRINRRRKRKDYRS